MVRAGETKLVKLHIAIAKGWHINSNEPQPNLQPTQISVESSLVEIERVDFPPAKEVRLGFAGEPVKVYDGTITVAVWLRAKPTASGSETLTLRFCYQACDEKRCLMPAERHLRITVNVAP
jgi:DsbC/DsbD-like thiol-disulfide interchange protein